MRTHKVVGEIITEVRPFVRSCEFNSQQVDELVNAESGLTYDGPQRAPVEFFVEGNGDLRERIISTQDDVASFLPLEIETYFHTASSIASNRSSGTGRLSSSRAAT